MDVLRIVKKLIFILFFSFSSSFPALAADLVLTPASGVYSVGQRVSVTLNVRTNGEAINAVSSQLKFSKDILQLNSISRDGTIIKLWAEEPSFSNTLGTINLEGVVLNGFTQSQGKVVTFNFTAKRTGQASVLFTSGSVLANDGEATNLLEDLSGAAFTITQGDQAPPKESTSPSQIALAPAAPYVVSTTHPSSDSWYANQTVTFTWDPPSDVIDVRGSLDALPTATPGDVYGTSIKTKTLNVPSDGIYYFHLQYKNSYGWGAITHFPVRIDTERPEMVSIKLLGNPDNITSKPRFILTGKDKPSGMGSYNVKLDYDDVIVVTAVGDETPYSIDSIAPGKHIMIVRGLDKAGNATTDSLEFTIQALESPLLTEYKTALFQGEKIDIAGKTKYASSTVEIVYVDEDDNEFRDTTGTDINGNFDFTFSPRLKEGVYQLKARVTDSDGGQSYFSEPIRVTVQGSKTLLIGSYIIHWFALAVICILLLAFLIALIWYLHRKFRDFRLRVIRNSERAEELLPKDIEALTKNLVENHDLLLAVSASRELTKEEDAMLENLKRQLETTDKDLIQKIKGSKYIKE